MVAVGEGQGAVVDLMGKENELSVDPLRVLLEEERGFDKGDGGSTPMKEVGDVVAEEKRGDVESCRYGWLGSFVTV